MKRIKYSVIVGILIGGLLQGAEITEAAKLSPGVDHPVQNIRVVLPEQAPPVLQNIAGVFARQLRERCGATVSIDHNNRIANSTGGTLVVSCQIDPTMRPESFHIEDTPGGGITVVGGDNLGILYGLGKLLRSARFDQDGFTPGIWRGVSAPEKPMRGIYFATHFHNFYHEAPIEDVERYVQDMGLWGYNTVIVWFDMHQFNGLEDPAAQAMMARLQAILMAAKKVGLKTGLTILANEGYANSPKELRAIKPGSSPHRGDFYGVEICPNKPGAIDLMLKLSEQRFAAFREIGLDCIVLWPYDQGGCNCEQCQPWGSNGYLLAAKSIAEQARKLFPQVRVILSTWLFDDGEWSGLSAAFMEKPDWVDYIMADAHNAFPRYPLDKGVPGGLPMLSFPEISMWGCTPWGGHGANPLPSRFQGIWDSVAARLSGGMPYSEGIFEDMNKAVYSQFYWGGKKTAMETLKEYIAFEFSPEAVEDVISAIQILEKNYPWPKIDAGSQAAFDLLQKVDDKLSAQTRTSWRWRILYLRGLLDKEHYANPGKTSEAYRQAILELIKIYHAETAHHWIKPDTSNH